MVCTAVLVVLVKYPPSDRIGKIYDRQRKQHLHVSIYPRIEGERRSSTEVITASSPNIVAFPLPGFSSLVSI